MTRTHAWLKWLAFPLVQLAELLLFVVIAPLCVIINAIDWLRTRR